MAGLFELNSTFNVVFEATVTGKENWAHFPLGAMNPITLGGKLTGSSMNVGPIVDPKSVFMDVEVYVSVAADVTGALELFEPIPVNGRRAVRGEARMKARSM